MPLAHEAAHLITRRHSLKLLAGAAVVGVLGISGCGGVGGGSAVSPLVIVTRATRVMLPPGFSLPISELSAETAFAAAPLASATSFEAAIARDAGPTFAYLRHIPTGKAVLFGLAGSVTLNGQDRSEIGTKGTAVAMLAMAFGLGGLAPADGRALVALLEAEPAVFPLVDALNARLAVNPFAIGEGDPAILSAVATAVAALKSGPVATLAAVAAATRETSREEADPLTLITPGVQSGSNVVQKDAPATIYYVNNYRRPAVYMTYKTGYATDAGDTMLDAASPIGEPTTLPPVASILSSIVSLNRTPLWAPIEGPGVALKLSSSEKKAYYQTVCLMASGKSEADGEPAFFSLPRYAGEVAGWRKTRIELNQHAWIGGIVYDLFASAVGGAATWISAQNAAAVIASVQGAGSAASQAVLDAGAGNLVRGTETCVKAAAEAGDIGAKVSEAIAGLIVRAQAAGVVTLTQQLINAVRALAAMIGEAIVIAGFTAALVDLGYTYTEILVSEKGAIWDVTLAKGSVALGVDKATMKAGESAVFNVSIVGGKESDYRYKWKVRGGNGVLGEVGSPNAGQDIETTVTTVSLLSAPGDQEGTTYVVTVEAIAKTNGASLGTATKSVKIQGQVTTVAGTRKTFTKAQQSDFDPSLYVFDALVTVEFTPTPGSKYFVLRGKGSPNERFPNGEAGKGFDSPDTTTEKTKTLLRNTLVATAFTGVVGLNQWQSAFYEQEQSLLDWQWSVECYPSRPA